MYQRRRSVRKWKLRGRRAQVSAVATILGLLLVVTFIANYITATLPGQMSVNDLNHVVQVEDQVGRLSALLQAASAANAVGAQFTQPITLGSAGTPPFAQADAGTIGPAINGSAFNLTLPLGGTWSSDVPSVAKTNYSSVGTGCTHTTGSASLSCTAASTASVFWNSTVTGNYGITLTQGTYDINLADSGTSTTALATLTTSLSTGTLNLLVIGNNDTIPLTLSGSGTANIEIVGNYDTLTVTRSGGDPTVNLFEVGLHDTTTISNAVDLTFLGNIDGTTDSVAVTATAADLNAATVVSVYFMGDTPTTTACPNDNLAASDSVSGGLAPVHHGGGFGGGTYTYYGDYNVTYNVTSTPVTLGTTPPVWWTEYNPSEFNAMTPAISICPFYVQASIPLSTQSLGGGFRVHLANSYIPQADVGFDQGAVVYAQQGAVPVIIDPPGITPTMTGAYLTSLSIWLPIFVGTIPVDYGLSTAEFETRLISSNTITYTTSGSANIAAGSFVNLTLTSPFAAGWMSFFNSTVPYDSFPFGCIGSTQACDGPYTTVNPPLGTVWVDIETGSRLATVTVQIATFSVSLV